MTRKVHLAGPPGTTDALCQDFVVTFVIVTTTDPAEVTCAHCRRLMNDPGVTST